MKAPRTFQFGAFASSVHISRELPSLDRIAGDFRAEGPFFQALLVCDEHTRPLAEAAARKGGPEYDTAWCVLEPGESAKNWASVEAILRAAAGAGLGRDGLFIGVGGGVIGDLTAFAASIYMRGCRLCLVSTTLLGMVDASLGGKTGFDLFGVKNMAGTFYPARHIYMPLESLKTLPHAEWKSGMAELIKTAVLEGGDFPGALESFTGGYPPGSFSARFPAEFIRDLLENRAEELIRCVSRAAALKGRIVAADPRETGGERRLLTLGHTFAHALESSAGLGTISHGEAVAWGMARACELGLALGITPRTRALEITGLIRSFGYETGAPHPLMGDPGVFLRALAADKKKTAGKVTFIVPDAQSARPAAWGSEFPPEQNAAGWESLLKQIINGDLSL
ncbi:MAG: 3-dehydroquinate synthase [Treponema sp.]|nr:3-dehydroquinate synthase [Treponema sp.]